MRRRVTVVGSVCLSVKSHLTSGASVGPENSVTYSTGNRGQNICGVFSETAPFKRYGVICLPGISYEGTAATFRALFRQHSFLRVLKRLNNRLNTTWITTGCKAASFFLLVSVFPLKSSVYFPLHVIRVRFNSACVFKDSSACAFKDSRTPVRRGFCTFVHSLSHVGGNLHKSPH